MIRWRWGKGEVGYAVCRTEGNKKPGGGGTGLGGVRRRISVVRADYVGLCGSGLGGEMVRLGAVVKAFLLRILRILMLG